MSRELLQKAYDALDGQWWAKDLCREIESALAAPTSEPWICAADRMPEPNVNVLCFSDLNSQPVIASWAGRDYNWIPTHWMPLPAAPGAAPPAAPATDDWSASLQQEVDPQKWRFGPAPTPVAQKPTYSEEEVERAVITLRGITQEIRGRGIGAVMLLEEQIKSLSAAPVVREPQGIERMFAVREGLCNADETAYFAARPQLDDRVKRRIFIAGFYAGWNRGIGGGK